MYGIRLAKPTRLDWNPKRHPFFVAFLAFLIVFNAGLGAVFLYRGITYAADMKVDVLPLVRSSYFQFRLDDPFLKTLPTYSAIENFYHLNDAINGTMPVLPGPLTPSLGAEETFKVKLKWCEAELGCKTDASKWKDAQPFVRVEGNLGGASEWAPQKAGGGEYTYNDPRMATMLMGLEENHGYDYQIEFSNAFGLSAITGSFTTKSTVVPHVDSTTKPTKVISKNTVDIAKEVKYYLSDCVLDYGTDRCVEVADVAGKRIQFNGDANGVETVIRGMGNYYSWNGGLGGWNSGALPQYHGSADNWLVIEGRAGDKVVLDGSDPQYDTTGQGNWVKCDSSNNYCGNPNARITDNLNIYRTSTPYFDPAASATSYGENGCPETVAATSCTTNKKLAPNEVFFERPDGTPERLLNVTRAAPYNNGWTHNFNEIVNRVRGNTDGQPGNGMGANPYEGTFYNDQGYVYVHLNDGVDPNTVHMKIPLYRPPFQFTTSNNIIFRNLTIQYFKTALDGQMGQINFNWSRDIYFDRVTLKGSSGIVGGADAQNIVVKDSNFIGGFVPRYDQTTHLWKGYDWNHIKLSIGYEDGALFSAMGYGISVLNSTFIGAHDAITPAGTAAPYDDYDLPPNHPPYNSNVDYSYNANRSDLGWEVDGNYFRGTEDDAVEMRVSVIGAAVTRNKFDGVYKGISLAPIVGGPYYIVRNTYVSTGDYTGTNNVPVWDGSVWRDSTTNHNAPSFLKIGNKNYSSDTAYKLIANNTIINTDANYANTVASWNQDAYLTTALDTRLGTGFTQEGRNFNLNVLNNIMVADIAPIQFSNDYVACYPQIFDNNFYIVAHHDKGYGAQGSDFALVANCPFQGDNIGDLRASATFENWQQGVNTRNARVSWPMTPADPVYHSSKYPWIHDTNGKYVSYDNGQVPADLNFAGFSLSDPGNVTTALEGDFRPKAGTQAVGMGRDLANITYDVGPGWTGYAEVKGSASAGAQPAENLNTTAHLTLTLEGRQSGRMNLANVTVRVKTEGGDLVGSGSGSLRNDGGITVSDPSFAAISKDTTRYTVVVKPSGYLAQGKSVTGAELLGGVPVAFETPFVAGDITVASPDKNSVQASDLTAFYAFLNGDSSGLAAAAVSAYGSSADRKGPAYLLSRLYYHLNQPGSVVTWP